MIQTSRKMIPVSILFLIVGLVFLLCAIFAPLSYEGILLSPPDIAFYISKSILFLLSIIYFILSSVVLLYYFNRKIYIVDNEIHYINYLRKETILNPKKCEIKIFKAKFDLFHKEKKRKICSISFMSDGDVFDFIRKIEKAGTTRK